MDVTFSRVADSASPDPDILLQQMVECQNGINSDYASKQNWTISKFTSHLQDYLNRHHPGMAVPQDGPQFEFVKNTIEEIAILTLELWDAMVKYDECRKFLHDHVKKVGDCMEATVKDSSKTVKEKKDILKRLVLDSVEAMTQVRLDYQRQCQRVEMGYGKLLDMTKKTTGTVSGREDDAFLGILRKGILHKIAAWPYSYHEFRLQKMLICGRCSIFKTMEKIQLDSLSHELKLLEGPRRVVGHKKDLRGIDGFNGVEENDKVEEPNFLLPSF